MAFASLIFHNMRRFQHDKKAPVPGAVRRGYFRNTGYGLILCEAQSSVKELGSDDHAGW
jgi:hypothetical protein